MRFEFNATSTYYRVLVVDADTYDEARAKVEAAFHDEIPERQFVSPSTTPGPIDKPILFTEWDSIDSEDPDIELVSDYPTPTN